MTPLEVVVIRPGVRMSGIVEPFSRWTETVPRRGANKGICCTSLVREKVSVLMAVPSVEAAVCRFGRRGIKVERA